MALLPSPAQQTMAGQPETALAIKLQMDEFCYTPARKQENDKFRVITSSYSLGW
jgi:hypothetical protein